MKITVRRYDKGFTLIEILIVIFVMTLTFFVIKIKIPESSLDVENEIVASQLEAIAKRKTIYLDEEICPILNCWFNAKGNINKPVTLYIEQGGIKYELVIWLGFGRFKITKRIFND